VQRGNVSGPFEYDDADPEGYRAGAAMVGSLAGGVDLNVKAYEIPPGESLCPYHYEYEEEWLLVLEGAVTLRTPDGEYELLASEIACFSRGPEGAHKASNRGETAARLLMFSSAREPSVAVYPDSGKIGVSTGNRVDSVRRRIADGDVDYYDGEA
jgi:uncharacterized cupin superfamily protein